MKFSLIERLSLKIFLSIVITSFPFFLMSQKDRLVNDSKFFSSQIGYYNNWITSIGLENTIEAKSFKTDSNKLYFTIELKYHEEVKAISVWEQLKKDFNSYSTMALEERLFYKVVTTMELLPHQIELSIINYPVSGGSSVLNETIFFDRNLGKLRKKSGYRNEVPARISIPSFVFDSTLNEIFTISDEAFSVKEQYVINVSVMDSLQAYFRKRAPDATVKIINESPAILSIMNIKSEVIPKAFLDFMNPHEYITVTVDNKINEDGILIECIIDGKIGSGIFRPRSHKGFRHMEDDYQEELELYASNFSITKVRKWVINILKSN